MFLRALHGLEAEAHGMNHVVRDKRGPRCKLGVKRATQHARVAWLILAVRVRFDLEDSLQNIVALDRVQHIELARTLLFLKLNGHRDTRRTLPSFVGYRGRLCVQGAEGVWAPCPPVQWAGANTSRSRS